MDWRKLACPDQYLMQTSSRRKVVSGLGLGLFVSFFFLSVVFTNVSFKASLLSPVLRGFNAYFLKGTAMDYACYNATSVCSNGSVSSRLDHFMDLNGTLYSNVSKNDESVEFSDSGSKGQILGAENGTLYGNVSKNGESLQFPDSNGTLYTNASKDGESVDFPDSGSKGKILGGENGTLYKNESSEGESVVVSDSGPKGQILGDKNGAFEESQVENGDSNVSSEGLKSVKDGGAPANGSLGSESEEIGSSGNGFYGDCDIYDGRWVRDESKPFYPPGSCPHIDRDFDCFLNKRPDDEYVKWRWQPYNCDIPSLNATDFLERLRGQKLVFVGDSLNRNMWESLVCILRHSIPDKRRVYEISGRTEFKKKGFYAFRFEDYNCTVDFVSSPFLVQESSFNGKKGSFETLRLDLMDKSTVMYHDADVLIFNTGHWWTHEKTSKGEDYYQEGNHVHKRLKVLDAYNRALATWARWVDKYINHEKTQVIFRGYSETHFRGGPWNSGGQCHKETEPFLDETHLAKYPSKMRALERVIHEMKYPLVYMNISRLTDYRKDGHPSIYRKVYKTEEEQLTSVHSQDCSHWCLPGVPDTWNELLYASLLKTGRGSWRL